MSPDLALAAAVGQLMGAVAPGMVLSFFVCMYADLQRRTAISLGLIITMGLFYLMAGSPNAFQIALIAPLAAFSSWAGNAAGRFARGRRS